MENRSHNILSTAIPLETLGLDDWPRRWSRRNVDVDDIFVSERSRCKHGRVAFIFRLHVPTRDIASCLCIAARSEGGKDQQNCADGNSVSLHHESILR